MATSKAAFLPSNLAYKRGIDLSDGVMSGVRPAEGFGGLKSILERDKTYAMAPIEVSVTTARGTIANYDSKAPADRVGMDSKAINAANISRVEEARLHSDSTHLHVVFTCRFNANNMYPSMCNSPDFAKAVSVYLDAYKAQDGYKELALRYFMRLANGSWLWRNAYADDVEIGLSFNDKTMIIGEYDIDVSKGAFTLEALAQKHHALAREAIDMIALALASEEHGATIGCSALAYVGAAGEVFPSQEFASESTSSVGTGTEKPTKILSKVMSQDGKPVATIHARKLGNAIRTIDDWHGVEGVGAIAIEVFGANTHQSVAYRIGTGAQDKDFYTLFKNVEDLTKSASSGLTGDHHFVAACLVRGGVYGFGSSK